MFDFMSTVLKINIEFGLVLVILGVVAVAVAALMFRKVLDGVENEKLVTRLKVTFYVMASGMFILGVAVYQAVLSVK